MAVLVFRGGRWRWGRGGWGGFIPHAGPVRASGTSVASRWMQVWLVAAGERCVSSRATTSTGTPWRIRPDVICLVCEPVRGPRPPVWFLAGPVGHMSADRWQPASYRVPAAPRGTDAGRRSAARSPRSAFVLAGGRSQPDLLDERMSVGYPGGGVTTGSEPAPADPAAGLGRGRVGLDPGHPGRVVHRGPPPVRHRPEPGSLALRARTAGRLPAAQLAVYRPPPGPGPRRRPGLPPWAQSRNAEATRTS
jgi:hypothetical protein